MKGTLVSIKPDGSLDVAEASDPDLLPVLKAAIGGGYLEAVPGFNTVPVPLIGGGSAVVVPCVAFCDEDGKRKRLPLNERATALWNDALRRRGLPGLVDSSGRMHDVLVGSVAVVYGDREFMAAL